MHRFTTTTFASIAIGLGLLSSSAVAGSDRAFNGHYLVEEHSVLEPDSTICGFPITLDVTGRGTFNARFDADGNFVGVHTHERTIGTVSANGISLRDFSSDNKFLDAQSLVMRENGLVFRDTFIGGMVVIMDRGRLVWNFDPDTGEPVGDPLFEAGPHPELHGDVAALCAALTP